MHWTIEQLKAFIAAAETGSFSAASRKLGKAQSRISTAIANLEIDLGFELFDRSGKYPVLTESGKQMLIDAEAIMQQCQRMNARAIAVNAGDPLTFHVAIDEAVPVNTFETLFSLMVTPSEPTYPMISRGHCHMVNEVADIGFIYRVKSLGEQLEWYDLSTVSRFNLWT